MPAVDLGLTERFEAQRKVLLALAYRMLGTVQDAEDVVQDAWLRWQASTETVHNDRAYLCRIATRLCLDRAKSAQALREEYPGPWLPDLVDTDAMLPDERAEMAESVSMAFMVLLQSLNASERAAFLLHDVFAFEYDELAQALNASDAACRQWVSRARSAIAQRKPRYQPDAATVQRVAMAFLQACTTGDVQQVMAHLAADARSITDSGGRVKGASRHAIFGADSVAALFVSLAPRLPAGATFEMRHLNAQPALVILANGVIYDVLWFEIVDGKVRDVFAMLNPDRLARLSR